MSWVGSAWASKQATGSIGNKCVLMMIADATSHDNPILILKISTLAEKCNANEATVRRALSALEELGLIARIDRFQDNVQRACGYVLMTPENAGILPEIVEQANRLTAFYHVLRVGVANCKGALTNVDGGCNFDRVGGLQIRNPEHTEFFSSLPKAKAGHAPKKAKDDTKPTELEWVAYCSQTWPDWFTSSEAWAHYESVGWMAGKAKIKNWKAAARTSYGRAKEWKKLGVAPTHEWWKEIQK